MSPNESPTTTSARRSRWLLVPPPPLFVVSFLVGTQLDRVVPLHVAPTSLQTVARLAGIAVVALAALLLLPAPALFLRHRTTIIPHREARRLVTSGPYRITRNPMYLALSIAYVGVALWTNQAWPLPLLLLPLWVLNAKVIPFEEANLARMFGSEYRAYQQRVRRWL